MSANDEPQNQKDLERFLRPYKKFCGQPSGPRQIQIICLNLFCYVIGGGMEIVHAATENLKH